ncbi:DUF4365 domain-containing protein [Tenacibaculum maritimum]|uniref:DUF4365 domain-containing protein n=1 Tax=Tenacibaculum maritimum TaxID=107401 RepID=UPI0012E54AB9|nr:DUF4365 domain-containing protein [Tenacibaculum maritimum]CAA0256186.1 conserved hypothetical protein [Tenacibaculum maritimum]
MRFNNTERLGVIKTDGIVTKNLGWIFREQTISDVGIDAIIEQVDDGYPTGKLIAVQIKSGKGNFHLSDKKITHYVSNIHYNYWLSLNIPIILIAYFPESDEIYWNEISESTLKRTKKKWKIEIPKTKKFNENSEKKLIQLLSTKPQENIIFELYKGSPKSKTIFDIAERVECLSESTKSIYKIVEIISEMRECTNEYNLKLNEFIEKGYSDKDQQVNSSFKGFGRSLNIISKRLENEVELFSDTFSEGFYAYEQIITLNFELTENITDLLNAKSSIENIPESVSTALEGIESMKSGVNGLPKKYSTLREARSYLLETIDSLIFEFNEAGNLAKKLIEKITA